MEIHRHELKNARIGVYALFKFRPSLVSGKGQCSDWTVPVVNWDRKAKSDSELCGLIEELPLRHRKIEFRPEINAPSEGLRSLQRFSDDGIDDLATATQIVSRPL